MTQLDQVLTELRGHEGVEHLVLVGRDGLLIHEVGDPAVLGRDTFAALIPGLASSCTALGRAADRGAFTTAVLEFAAGVVVVAPVSAEILLAGVLRAGVGFAPLLRALRQRRDQLASLF